MKNISQELPKRPHRDRSKNPVVIIWLPDVGLHIILQYYTN